MHRIDVHKLADEAKFNSFHGLVLAWCVLIIIIDGYDLAVAGTALPSIMKEMGVDASTAGFMASSALFGMMFGAIFFGTLADKCPGRGVAGRSRPGACARRELKCPAGGAAGVRLRT